MELFLNIFYISLATIYFYSGAMSLLTYKVGSRRLLRYFFPLCISAALYALNSFMALHHESLIYFYLGPVVGFITWYNYINLINFHFNVSSKFSIFTKQVCLLGAGIYSALALDFVTTNILDIMGKLPLTDQGIFFQTIGYGLRSSNLDMFLVGVIISILMLNNVFYLKMLFKERKREPLLFIGLIASIGTVVSDCLFATSIISWLIPIACIGFLLEVMRFYFLAHQIAASQITSLESKLVKLSSLADLGTLSVGISHDIRTPLQVISLSSQLLRKEYGDLKQLDKIDSSNDKIVEIVDTYLAMINNNEAEVVKASLIKTVQDTLSLCQDKIRAENISVSVKNDLKSSYNIEDYNKLFLVLMNLISNSCHAISNHHEKWIRIHLKEEEGIVSVDIVDSGPGIPEEIREQIFERQFSTKPAKEGSGLGLFLVKKLVQEIGGEINLADNQSHTTFRLSFSSK
jgi:signal transduction histidine kinase